MLTKNNRRLQKKLLPFQLHGSYGFTPSPKRKQSVGRRESLEPAMKKEDEQVTPITAGNSEETPVRQTAKLEAMLRPPLFVSSAEEG